MQQSKGEPRSLLAKAGPLVIARFIGAAFAFGIPLVLARAMALDEYGTYKQLFLVAQTLYYVLPFGIAQSLYYFIPRNRETRPWVFQTLVSLLGLAVVGFTAVAFGAGLLTRALGNAALFEYRWELATYVACVVAALPLEVILTSLGRTRAAAGIYLGSDLLRSSAMILPVLAGFGLKGSMVAMAAFSALRVVAIWVVLFRATTGPFWTRGLLRSQWVYAAPFGAAMLLSIPQQNAHQYAVAALVPTAMFAIYAVGCFQLPLVDLLYSPVSEVLMVTVGDLERQGRLRDGIVAFRSAAATLSYVFLPLAAFLFVAAPQFISALFTSKFLEAVPVFRVSVLSICLSMLPVDGLLRARNETRYLFAAYLVKALATAPLVYFGVRWFGMMGGIGSWALAELIGKTMLLFRVPAALDLGNESRIGGVLQCLPRRDLARAGAAAIGAAALAWVATSFGAQWLVGAHDLLLKRFLPLTLVGSVFALSYFGLLTAVGVRPLAVLAALRKPQQTAG